MLEPLSTGAIVGAVIALGRLVEKAWSKWVDKNHDTNSLKLDTLAGDVILLDAKMDKFGEAMSRVAVSLDHVTDVLERIEQRQANDDMVDAVVEKFNAVSLKSRS